MTTERANEILRFIESRIREHGASPTIREIGKAFKISSTNGVRYYLTQLEKAGKLERVDKISRGLRPVGMHNVQIVPRGFPILGRVAAGQPTLAQESFDETLEPGELFGDVNGMFALRVRGDSMINAGILENDFVIVRQQDRATTGEIIVALIGEEATVKYYRPKRGTIELVAANEKYEPIVVGPEDDFRILGIVKGVIRTIGR